jgi:WS/DGAT/MGAT family acyltransferase
VGIVRRRADASQSYHRFDPASQRVRTGPTGQQQAEETMARSSSRRERLSPVDNAWLRMDSPGNLMMIVGVDLFEGRCDLPRLKRVIQSHLLQYRQFRSRVVHDAAGAWWEDDPDFDIDQHLVRIGLPGRGGKAELQKLAATLAGQALDPTKPLWQFHLVEHYRDGDFDGHALIIRIHHAIGDGIALVGVFLSMTTTSPDEQLHPLPAARKSAKEEREWWEQWLRPFTDATVRAIDVTGDVATRVLQAYGAVLEDPNLAGEAATEYARMAAQVSRDAAALALMEMDSRTSLKGRPGGSKAVAWTDPLPLTDVKTVGKALGCSVNDVLLSCATGAIRGYLLERGDDLDGAELRAMVPVNLRAPGKAKSLGNKFGLVPLLLPIGIEHPIERVLEVHRRMDELKGGYTAVLAMALLGMAGLAPRGLQKQVLDLLARKATAVMTNVPGPQQQLYLAGAPMKQVMFWVPQSGDIGVGVSILSYAGTVQFSLISDKKICRDPQAIIDRFRPEFENLVHAVLLMPWDEEADPDLASRSLHATADLADAAEHLHGKGREPPPRHGATPARAKAARAPVGAEAAADGEAAKTAPGGRPAGLRKRKSAFAAARSAAP